MNLPWFSFLCFSLKVATESLKKLLGIQPNYYKSKFEYNRAPVWILLLTQQFESMNEFCLR